jgi:hypothetical protein
MDPTDFYHLGLRIIGSRPAPDPASCRTAIGRAYYAALNRVDQAFAGWGVSCGRGPQKHGLAVKFLHATNDPDLMAASKNLNDRKALRNRADYDMNDAAVERTSQARDALDLSRRVMDYLQVVDNDSIRKNAAMHQIAIYKQKTNTP